MVTGDNREASRDYQNPMPWFGTAPDALLQGFANLPGTEVHVVTCAQRKMKSPEKLAENIFFHSLYVPKIGWMRTGYQGCIRATRRRLQQIQPDIVHGQGTERDCALSAIFSGFPNILTIHGNMRAVARGNRARAFSFGWLAAKLEAFVLPRTSGVVCISSYTLQLVKSLARKTWLVPNAVDSSFFQVANSPLLPPRILCVGNILKLKNQCALILALDGLHTRSDFELIFLGSANPGTPYAVEFLKAIETRPWCRYAGFVDREGLKAYLTSASGIIHPTLEDNCPMVILEAMAAGVPVAAARIGGIPDLIRPGETGILFNPMEKQSMSKAMEELLAAASWNKAAYAREEALNRFHPRTIAQRHVEIYQEVLSSIYTVL